jgi:hypothetical protein
MFSKQKKIVENKVVHQLEKNAMHATRHEVLVLHLFIHCALAALWQNFEIDTLSKINVTALYFWRHLLIASFDLNALYLIINTVNVCM